VLSDDDDCPLHRSFLSRAAFCRLLYQASRFTPKIVRWNKRLLQSNISESCYFVHLLPCYGCCIGGERRDSVVVDPTQHNEGALSISMRGQHRSLRALARGLARGGRTPPALLQSFCQYVYCLPVMCQAMHQLMFVLFLLKRSDSLQCLAIIIISVTTKNKEMNNQIIKGGGDTNSDPGYEVDIQFSHVHLYVDRVCEVSTYKEFEDSLNLFQEKYDEATENEVVNHEVDHCGTSLDVDVGRRVWQSIISKRNKTDENNDKVEAFASHGRDVVRQLIAGFGFRITGCHANYRTNSVVVTSKDPNGIQIVVSAMKNDGDNKLDDEAAMAGTDNFYHHFAASNITRFYQAHSNRQGIAVMAFEVGHQCLEGIFHRYDEKHPELVPKEFKNGPVEYDTEARTFEVFAYYKGEMGMSPADEGTMLRFIEPIKSNATNTCKLPGIVPVKASFSQCHPAFFDHWVSNVISRTGFLDTLEDTLYFTPKVDFNAGVVAAGEAQIESTVTGNTSSLTSEDVSSALSDQSQIYLPINNALTKVG